MKQVRLARLSGSGWDTRCPEAVASRRQTLPTRPDTALGTQEVLGDAPGSLDSGAQAGQQEGPPRDSTGSRQGPSRPSV